MRQVLIMLAIISVTQGGCFEKLDYLGPSGSDGDADTDSDTDSDADADSDADSDTTTSPIAEGTCEDPYMVDDLPYTHEGTTSGQPQAASNPCMVATGTGNQVVYQLAVQAGEEVQVSLDVAASVAWASVLSVCNAGSSCVASTYDTGVATFTPSTSGSLYVVVSHNSGTHSYTLSIKLSPPPCPVNSGWPCSCNLGTTCDDGSECLILASLNPSAGICAPVCSCGSGITDCDSTLYSAISNCAFQDFSTPPICTCALLDCDIEDGMCPPDQTCQNYYETMLCWP